MTIQSRSHDQNGCRAHVRWKPFKNLEVRANHLWSWYVTLVIMALRDLLKWWSLVDFDIGKLYRPKQPLKANCGVIKPSMPNGNSALKIRWIHFEFKGCWIVIYNFIQILKVHSVSKQFILFCLFVCFVALRPKSTAMVIAGWSVHLTTLFPGQAWTSS